MGSSDDDYGEEEEMEVRAVKITPPVFFLKNLDKLAKEWGWEMLLPFKGSPKWSEYCNYLQHYYRHHSSVIAEVTGNSLVHAAETCLKKEVELVSLWDRRMKECTNEVLPRRTFILSSLILEFADKVKSRERLSDVPTAALLCITKEADLICEMLSFGAKPTDHLIVQSTEIRMCALGLANNQLCDPVPAAAAMVGIMKETTKICGWMSKHKKLFDLFDIDLDNDFELGRQVRQQTLYLMIIMLEMFTFPVSASAEHKPVKEKTFSGNIPRNDGNDIAPPEAANTTGGNTQDQEKITGADIVAEVTNSLVASAEVCRKKEEELVSLWRTEVVRSPIVILPVNTIAESNLILEHARSIMFAKEGGLPVASTVAFANLGFKCISKEADLMCELLKHGAKPTDGIIQQSSMIRMCALSLMRLQGSDAINATDAMVGITKACKLMCDWIKKEDKLITFSFFARHELEECRFRNLDVMLRILKDSSFPSSKKPKDEPQSVPASTNGISIPEPKIISENGSSVETQDKDVILEGLSTVSSHDEWTPLSVSGLRPKPRYEHGATVLQNKMYIFGGNHNGRYLSDLQALDLKSLTWSKVDAKLQAESADSTKTTQIAPCAGHSLISWGNKFLSIAGHTKDPSEGITVKEFDPLTCTWSIVKTYGKPPVSHGGPTVTVVGTTLVLFGGEDAKRCHLNDLHILDLETMRWDDVDAIGTPPSPRSDHAAACHADRYLLIFGGGSHATCFNDLHVLDLQTMEWSRPKQQGLTPSPRAGHAGATVGEYWYIVGGGNNKSGVSETLVLNMSTLTWSVVSTVEGRVPLASEGMTLVHSNYNGYDYLISFGGYNGRYSNEVYTLKLSLKSDSQSTINEETVSDSTSRVIEPEAETSQDGKIREIAMDSADSDLNRRNDEASEQLLAHFKAQKEELEATLSREQLQTVQLKEDIAQAETRNAEVTKELQAVRDQLASEQSRCSKLEVDVAELRQKLQSMDALEKEVELLRRQKAASEQAALDAKQRQSSGGMWGLLAGSLPPTV